jgi:quercetin dioxygenase-like cupin family protein
VVAHRTIGVAALDDACAAAIASAIVDAEVAADVRQRMRATVLESLTQPPPVGTRTVRGTEASGWQRVNDLVSIKVLRLDQAANNQTILMRMQPGAEIVAHPHSQEEECFVVAGEIEIGGHWLGAGDMHIAAPGSQHATIVSRSGALLMVRAEIPSATFSIV